MNYFITHKYTTKNATFPANKSTILSAKFQITALAFCACSQASVTKKKTMAMNHCNDCRWNILTVIPKNNPTNPPTSRCFQVFFNFILFSFIILLMSAICSNYVQIKVCNYIFSVLSPYLIFVPLLACTSISFVCIRIVLFSS